MSPEPEIIEGEYRVLDSQPPAVPARGCDRADPYEKIAAVLWLAFTAWAFPHVQHWLVRMQFG